MTISLSDAGKRFNRDWIFRHFTYTFETGNAYAITGPNGSGKSTLLQVLSGGMMINEGKISARVALRTSIISIFMAFIIGVVLQFVYKTGPYTLLIGFLVALISTSLAASAASAGSTRMTMFPRSK